MDLKKAALDGIKKRMPPTRKRTGKPVVKKNVTNKEKLVRLLMLQDCDEVCEREVCCDFAGESFLL